MAERQNASYNSSSGFLFEDDLGHGASGAGGRGVGGMGSTVFFINRIHLLGFGRKQKTPAP
jgi:hypothetical protein